MKNIISLQRPSLGEEELAAVSKVFESRWLGMGAMTKQFEEKIGKYLGAKNVIAVNTGTSALHIALDAIGLKPGDEVIVPSLTFVSSIQAIRACGGNPVFCEVLPNNLNMDISDVLKKINKHTKAIMPVHYGGVSCDMDSLMKIARKYKLRIVEDAAHAFGSTYKGRKIGSFGDITCFSFDPIKNITCGEGGAVVTSDDKLAKIIIRKRILGISNDTWTRYKGLRNYHYTVVDHGHRYHMSDINAAIGLEQLKKINKFKSRKKAIAKEYNKAFKNIDGLHILENNLHETFPFFYVVRIVNNKRDKLIAFLKEEGILTGVHYIPNHIQPLYKNFYTKLPVTEQLFNEILTLPLFVDMTEEQLDRVIESVRKFFKAI